MTTRQVKLLTADAKNRAWRTMLQGLAIDIGVATAIVIYQIASDPKPIVWAIVGASLLRTVAQSAASFVMRRFLDPSRIPTPLPPSQPGEPEDNVTPTKTTRKRSSRRR